MPDEIPSPVETLRASVRFWKGWTLAFCVVSVVLAVLLALADRRHTNDTHALATGTQQLRTLADTYNVLAAKMGAPLVLLTYSDGTAPIAAITTLSPVPTPLPAMPTAKDADVLFAPTPTPTTKE